jgi:hypothetical protein
MCFDDTADEVVDSPSASADRVVHEIWRSITRSTKGRFTLLESLTWPAEELTNVRQRQETDY